MDTQDDYTELAWADDMALRANTYGHGAWMDGFLEWIEQNAESKHLEGSRIVAVNSPDFGFSCTLQPLEIYPNTSSEVQSIFTVLDNIVFYTKRLTEIDEPLPFGLNYEGETVETVKQKLGTDDTTEHMGMKDGRISFFLDDARVVELTFAENNRIVQILVTRLGKSFDIRTTGFAYGDSQLDGYDEDDNESESNGEINFVTACALPYEGWVFVVEQHGNRPDMLCFYGLKTKQKQTILGVKVELSDEPERHWESFTTDIPVQKATVYESDEHGNTRIAMVSESGDVLFSRGIKPEKLETIPDVRAYGNWSFLANIQQIGNHLYTCGSYGQVYKRLGENEWQHIDSGLLQPVESTSYTDLLKLYVVKGVNENAIYAAGAQNDKKQTAKAFFYDGNRWGEIKLPKKAGFIIDIYVESESKIWMCGDEGTLLVGNAKQGFKYLSDAYTQRNFSNICLFKETMYIATDRGLLAYRPGRLFSGGKIEIVRPDLDDVYLHDIHTLTATKNVLWIIGEETIVRFDGKNWHNIYSTEED